jgi:hypothetical protein
MVHHGNQGKQAGKGHVRMSDSVCLKLVDISVYRNLPAAGAKTRRNNVIHRTDDGNIGAEGPLRDVGLPAGEIWSRSPASVPAPNRMVKSY